ncbi:cAMP-regulated phosphoprotein 21 isoform X2 [Ictalurus punctatus]|uniref:cAMP-regulated phosphoprotein 21 isoform X2 n=1 Tax=Ictalurus punctatus TaxID=7998 RepID=A0A9F7R0I2_ICTPU|nr:cAMP-regulated phosphoprotein 21 isoform X2 [Ictalurus punctatus]
MCDVETEEKKVLPESITERGTTPTCCTVETKEKDHHGSHSVEEQKTDAYKGKLKRNHKAKGKLIRSAAVCDDASPTESSSKESKGESSLTADTSECVEEQQEKCNDGNSMKKPSLSKESSLEYTDSTGIDLEEFLITTLKSSPRDRLMLLKLEQDMTDFMTDNYSYKKFPQMSSYHRMLVHRVAAYFGLEHNVDHSGKAVIINKASNSRIPEQRFAEHVQEERTEEKRSILKRDNSQEKEDNQLRMPRLKEQMRSKSFEEREEEYQKARERIFSQDSSCPVHSVYIETRGPEDCCNMYSETQQRRQLFRGTRDGSGRLSGSRQSSFELDCHWNDPRPWSSTDSDSSTWSAKPTHTHSDNNPKLCKPGTRNTLSTMCPNFKGTNSTYNNSIIMKHIFFIVPVTEPAASNSSAYVLVPAESSILPGTILLNPNTGQPYLNPDGTPAVYNPPVSQQPLTNQLNTMQPQAPPPPQTQQQPVMSHSLPQVQYSSMTFLPPQQVLTVSPSQFHTPEQSREDLSSQFSHMTLNQQSLGETSDMSNYYLHGAPPTHSYTQPQQNYAQPYPADSYMSSGMTLAMPTASPTQTCGQQSNQTPMYSYPGQCANTPQQYGPASYNTQTGTGYTALLTSQQQAYSNMVGAQVLPQTQKSIMGSYPSTSSYQMAPPLQSYPSTVLVSRQAGHNLSTGPSAGVSVYCNPLNHSPPPPLSVGITCQSAGCRNTCSRTQNQSWY